MARIRSVHPGLFTDEAFASLSPLARVLWIGVWTECDDRGIFEWKPLQMKMRLLPGDNADMPALMAELSAADVVRPFTANGKNYGAVRNFGRFQRPRKPNYLHPMPEEFGNYVASSARSTEPDDDEDEGGSAPPAPTRNRSSAPVRQKSGNANQMEDGGGREGEEEQILHTHTSPRDLGDGGELPLGDIPIGPAKVQRVRQQVDEETLLACVAAWNEIAAEAGLAQVSDLTDKRRAKLRARIASRWRTEPVRQFRRYCRALAAIPFYVGGSSSGWRATFDYAVKSDDVVIQVVERSSEGLSHGA